MHQEFLAVVTPQSQSDTSNINVQASDLVDEVVNGFYEQNLKQLVLYLSGKKKKQICDFPIILWDCMKS